MGLLSAARSTGADDAHRALDVLPALCGAGAGGMTDKTPNIRSGGNPEIPKGDGDVPVPSYTAAMPGWKIAAGAAMDARNTGSVPGGHRAARGDSTVHDVQGKGWEGSFHCL